MFVFISYPSSSNPLPFHFIVIFLYLKDLSTNSLTDKNFNIKDIKFDNNFSDGQYKKTADNSKLLKLYNFNFTDINIGLKNSCEWFNENYEYCRK